MMMISKSFMIYHIGTAFIVTLLSSTTSWVLEIVSLHPLSVTAEVIFWKSCFFALIIRVLLMRGRGWAVSGVGSMIGFGLAFLMTDYTIDKTGLPVAIVAAFYILSGEQLLTLAQDALSSREKLFGTLESILKFLRGSK